jgi:two-component system sensor histidine kinase CpxA
MSKERRAIGSVLKLGIKIFSLYWFAAALAISLAGWLAQERPRRSELLRDALASSLRANANIAVEAFEADGCRGAIQVTSRLANGQDEVLLAKPSGEFLCGSLQVESLQTLLASAESKHNVVARQYARFQVLALPVVSHSGASYIVVLKSTYSSPLRIFGWMPGVGTIFTSGVVAMLLTMIIVIPINRLRAAARSIATGNLNARVSHGRFFSGVSDDAIGWLIIDFNLMADRLESLVGAQKLLLRDVSHELRSPLARLSVGLALARDDANGAVHEHLDRIERETEGINKLIGQLLSLSYMETIQEVERAMELSAKRLVEDLLPNLLYEARGRNRVLTFSAIEDCWIYGDVALLQRAVENVVRNAIRYTPEHGEVHIQVQKDRDMVLIVIKDRGPGVPEAELGTILQPFYRVDRSRQPSTGGFGVGLAIADRAVKLHAGQITAVNRAGGGLSVEIRLPSFHPDTNQMEQSLAL